MRTIELTQGYQAIIDDDDLARVSEWSWSVIKPSGHTYAGARIKYKYTYLHRFILGEPPFKGAHADHINGDKLDCRKSNLRWVTPGQNTLNKAKFARNGKSSSKYKGVYFCKQTSKWRARAVFEGKTKSIGRFETELEAAEAYNTYAQRLHGEYARLNVF